MAVSDLIVIRHGESLGNAAGAEAYAADAEVIEVGARDADVELSPTGIEQATALGQGLRPLLADDVPTLVWSSTYVRAQQTAELGLGAAGLQLPVRLDERLRDRELGVLDLLTWKGVVNRFPLEAERREWLGKFYHRPPGGESWADVVLRVRSFLIDLNAVADGTRAVLFCHDALVLTFRYVCEGLTEAQVLDIGATTPVKNVSITRLGRDDDGGWVLRGYNDVTHLEQSEAAVTEHPGDADAPA
ncbi:histidine phosphatase family protein [uncultured Friedmanniella sp.]|uniref:histidine phosphatase family protein n=1 Tax=uncultured Friedmanniella sp. TaxID=335381 RepID=UPI0035C9CCCA